MGNHLVVQLDRPADHPAAVRIHHGTVARTPVWDIPAHRDDCAIVRLYFEIRPGHSLTCRDLSVHGPQGCIGDGAKGGGITSFCYRCRTGRRTPQTSDGPTTFQESTV